MNDESINPVLRNILSENRTALANERTLLAFIRTFATLLIAGVSLLKFFEGLAMHIYGFMLILFAIIILIYGFIKYYNMKDLIKKERMLTSDPFTEAKHASFNLLGRELIVSLKRIIK